MSKLCSKPYLLFVKLAPLACAGDKVRGWSGVGYSMPGARAGGGVFSLGREGLSPQELRFSGQGEVMGSSRSHSKRAINASDTETFPSCCHLNFVFDCKIETME